MANTASPYGLKPVALLGGRNFNGGTIKEIPMTVNSAVAIGAGDIIQIGNASAGQPQAVAATPTTASAGVIGVCVGVSFTDPVLKQTQHAQSLPANAISSGYTNVVIKVNDDPDQLFQLQSVGTVADTVLGKFCAVENFGVGPYGNSTVRGSTPANTTTLAFRIVGFASPAADSNRDLIVKFNQGVHMYYNATVLAN
jgi:dihydroorotase-like cyclic amidohydrolase